MWFSCFHVLPGSAEAQVIWGGLVKRLLIAYFIGNICAKKYQNPFMCVKVILSQRWDVFLRYGVYTDCRRTRVASFCHNVIHSLHCRNRLGCHNTALKICSRCKCDNTRRTTMRVKQHYKHVKCNKPNRNSHQKTVHFPPVKFLNITTRHYS